jgi:hypothetical protein
VQLLRVVRGAMRHGDLMIFVLTKTTRTITRTGTEWTWAYHQGSDKNIGEVLAVGPRGFASEREARSQIAVARRAFGGARVAKVVIPSDD